MPVQIPADLSRRVLLDCDEVLLQWSAGFQQWFEARFQERLHPNGPTEFNLAGWLPPAFQSRFFDLIVEFNESESYGALQPMDGAQDFLLLCRELDLEVYLVTAANSSSSTRAARLDNLAHRFGDMLAGVEFVELGQSKRDVLARHPRSIWVDDLPANVHAGIDAGHHGVLMAAAHNRSSRKDVKNDTLPLIHSLLDLVPGLEQQHRRPLVTP